jgi:hypothetical protein
MVMVVNATFNIISVIMWPSDFIGGGNHQADGEINKVSHKVKQKLN